MIKDLLEMESLSFSEIGLGYKTLFNPSENYSLRYTRLVTTVVVPTIRTK